MNLHTSKLYSRTLLKFIVTRVFGPVSVHHQYRFQGIRVVLLNLWNNYNFKLKWSLFRDSSHLKNLLCWCHNIFIEPNSLPFTSMCCSPSNDFVPTAVFISAENSGHLFRKFLRLPGLLSLTHCFTACVESVNSTVW